MKITSSLFIGTVVFFLTACNNKGTETEQATATDSLSAPTLKMTSSTGDTSIQLTPGSGLNEMPPSVTGAPGAKGATLPGMNPPHGEPGHRCEIAVGAPLDSKPTNAPPAQLQMNPPGNQVNNQMNAPTFNPNQQANTPPVPSGPTPEGMNPPHGQPGHDCAVAVGAPLPKKK